MSEEKAKFTFRYLSGRKFPSLELKETKEWLTKWSMNNRMLIQAYSFDEPFQLYQKNEFVKAFFKDKSIASSLKYLSTTGSWTLLNTNITMCKVEELSCSAVSMTFFDKLVDTGVVRESGHVVKCFDEYHNDMTISDELRKMLITEDSEYYDLFNDEEKKEFLYLIFKHLCLGGSLCQFEDQITPYLDTTKLLYKDLVSVFKDSSSGNIIVASCVLKVSAKDKLGAVYPSSDEHFQDFSYFIIDPLKRLLFVFYHKFGVTLLSID